MRRPPNKKVARFCPFYRELLALRAENKKLRNLVSTDPMTNLYNYRFFSSVLKQEMEKAKRTKIPVSLIMIDIDFFKKINDTYGHTVGDSVLKHVARVIKESIRTTDTACRYGGEEFAVVLPGTYIDSAVAIAERIKRNIESSGIKCGNNEINVTISLGVSSFDGTSEETVTSFVDRADQCLLEAKRKGKNVVVSDRPLKDTQISQEEKSLLLSFMQKNAENK